VRLGVRHPAPGRRRSRPPTVPHADDGPVRRSRAASPSQARSIGTTKNERKNHALTAPTASSQARDGGIGRTRRNHSRALPLSRASDLRRPPGRFPNENPTRMTEGRRTHSCSLPERAPSTWRRGASAARLRIGCELKERVCEALASDAGPVPRRRSCDLGRLAAQIGGSAGGGVAAATKTGERSELPERRTRVGAAGEFTRVQLDSDPSPVRSDADADVRPFRGMDCTRRLASGGNGASRPRLSRSRRAASTLALRATSLRLAPPRRARR